MRNSTAIRKFVEHCTQLPLPFAHRVSTVPLAPRCQIVRPHWLGQRTTTSQAETPMPCDSCLRVRRLRCARSADQISELTRDQIVEHAHGSPRSPAAARRLAKVQKRKHAEHFSRSRVVCPGRSYLRLIRSQPDAPVPIHLDSARPQLRAFVPANAFVATGSFVAAFASVPRLGHGTTWAQVASTLRTVHSVIQAFMIPMVNDCTVQQ